MNRIWSLMIALLALFALAFAAATLESTGTTPFADRSSTAASGGSGGGADVPVSADENGRDGFDSLLSPFDVADARSAPPSGRELGLLAVASCLLVVGVGTVLFLLTGDDDATTDGRPTTDAASQLADRSRSELRVDHAAVTNDVYRAWNDMVARLGDVDDARTPEEIATKAREAGLPADPIEELTSLFRSVRYGRHRANDRRERRATDALQRLSRSDAEEDER